MTDKNIGQLRQWINEGHGGRLITNDDIKAWLEIDKFEEQVREEAFFKGYGIGNRDGKNGKYDSLGGIAEFNSVIDLIDDINSLSNGGKE